MVPIWLDQIWPGSVNAAPPPGTNRDFGSTYLDATDDGGTHEVAPLVSLDVDVPAVEQQLGSLVHAALDQAAHPLLGLGGDQRPDICARLVSWKGPKSPAFGVTHCGICLM